MLSCTRRLEFDAAHRVLGHEGKCADLHGHRYAVELYAERISSNRPLDPTDIIGRVIDFSILKNKIGKWIDENWDHNILLNSLENKELVRIITINNKEKTPFMFIKKNPTAENIASHLLHDVCASLLSDKPITVFKVRVYETPNCFAEAQL